jgi:hypothetical protein
MKTICHPERSEGPAFALALALAFAFLSVIPEGNPLLSLPTPRVPPISTLRPGIPDQFT